jgi:UDP-glucose 4-epimerase
LGDAHLKALGELEDGHELELNLGTGRGTSVRQIIDACRRITGHPIPETVGARRPGDPPRLVADARLARETLGWRPRYAEIDSIVETAWRWHQGHPNGYAD